MTHVAASFKIAAQVDQARRRIVGLVLPFGQEGTAALDGEPATLVFEAGGMTFEDPKGIPLVINHTGGQPVFAGRARDLIETDQGIVGTFSILPGPNGDQLLAEAAEGLRTGLSVEAELEHIEDDGTGVMRVTAAHPGVLKRVAAVETPAFPAARMSEVAAEKVSASASPRRPSGWTVAQLRQVTAAVESLTAALAAQNRNQP